VQTLIHVHHVKTAEGRIKKNVWCTKGGKGGVEPKSNSCKIMPKNNDRIIIESYLVHASLNTEIKELKSINLEYLYATDNLGFAINCAIGNNVPFNAILLQTYFVFGFQFAFASIAEEHEEGIRSIPIKLYYCRKEKFKKYVKVGSKLSKITFNLLITPGNEYITKDCVIPSKENIIYLTKSFNYSVHRISDHKIKIVLKAFFNLFIGRNCFTRLK
jgi:hypothetical protein